MNDDKLFIDYKLPKALSKEELYNLFKQAKEGSKEARNKIITHNIRLVLYAVTTKFQNVYYDKKDLVSIGILGLMKAVDTYDLAKGFTFSTYAKRCIDNEIVMFLRKLKKDNNIDSLDRTVFRDEDGYELNLEHFLCDEQDFVEEKETAEVYKIIREIIKDLPNINREIILLYFGFYNDKIYTQKQIANKLNTSQAQVSRIITKTIENMREILEYEGVIELHSKQYNQEKKGEEKTKKL